MRAWTRKDCPSCGAVVGPGIHVYLPEKGEPGPGCWDCGICGASDWIWPKSIIEEGGDGEEEEEEAGA